MPHRHRYSRPQWRRQYLDGLIGLNVISGAYRRYPRYVFDRGEQVWVYGGVPVSGKTALAGTAWAVQTFLDGADGVMPWSTLGSGKAWSKPEATALILPPPTGREKRPYGTLRLKMLRRGQQDVELLRLLTETHPSEINIQPYPRDLEVATITFLGFDQKPIDTVRIAKDPDSERWILENGDDVLRFFKVSMVHINLTPLDFELVSVIPD